MEEREEPNLGHGTINFKGEYDIDAVNRLQRDPDRWVSLNISLDDGLEEILLPRQAKDVLKEVGAFAGSKRFVAANVVYCDNQKEAERFTRGFNDYMDSAKAIARRQLKGETE